MTQVLLVLHIAKIERSIATPIVHLAMAKTAQNAQMVTSSFSRKANQLTQGVSSQVSLHLYISFAIQIALDAIKTLVSALNVMEI